MNISNLTPLTPAQWASSAAEYPVRPKRRRSVAETVLIQVCQERRLSYRLEHNVIILDILRPQEKEDGRR